MVEVTFLPTDDNDGGGDPSNPCGVEAEASAMCILQSGDACDSKCTSDFTENPTLAEEAATNPEAACFLKLALPETVSQ